MTLSTQTPWVQFQMNAWSALVSTPTTIIDEALNTLVIVDSLQVTNTFRQQVFLDIMVVRTALDPDTEELVRTPYYYVRNCSLEPFESKDLLKEKTLYLQPGQMAGNQYIPGDILVANSDAFDHQFDCMVSYRQLTPPPIKSWPVSLKAVAGGPNPGQYTVTATTSEPLSLTPGNIVLIQNAFPDAYNGFYAVDTIESSTAFRYLLPSNPGQETASGTPQVALYNPL